MLWRSGKLQDEKRVSDFSPIPLNYFTRFLDVTVPISENIRNAAKSAVTIVAPTGVEQRMERIIPVPAHTTEMTAAQIVTLLKLLNTLIADSAGKIISAEISKEPTRFIAITMIMAVIIAIIRL